ncbi:MAG: exodeoxyribonuclease VII small subunit [Clostridiales Family XIII bacterium]|jgi:exodeoxyribonuclease VII small subunit|nr:exodeoxyribonuclease VII small subunit [Clostridiales Family XIII bacterium]
MAKTDNLIPENVKFEDAMAKLEELSGKLSGGDVPLDEAIALYEEGVAWYKACKAILDDASRRILVIEEGRESER